MVFAAAPAEMTSATPSLPGTAIGWGVEREVVKAGLVGYVPCMVLISAGLIGEASMRSVARSECGGDMEWVWRLRSHY